MSTFKQERIDGVVREIERKSLQEIAMIILDERFEKKVSQYEAEWLDELADKLRDGDSFNEMQLMQELYTNPKKELIERYLDK
jgi:SRSO17 transposase